LPNPYREERERCKKIGGKRREIKERRERERVRE